MIQIAPSTDNFLWNQFLDAEKDNQLITIAHNPSLGPILEKTFGYTIENMLITMNDQMIGVLPLVKIGNKLVSMPHFSYGGPLISSKEDLDIKIEEIFHGQRFEIRSFSKLSKNYTDEKISFVVELDKTIDEHLRSFPSKFRNKILKPVKMGYTVTQGKQDLLDDFYLLYSTRMLEKGSPPLGKKFFQNIINYYEFGEVEITMVYDGKKPIATGFSLSYMGFNEICWASSDLSYNKYNINSFLYWNVIISSITKNFKYFSMGRSTKNSNNHFYKKQWNPIEHPIFYNYSEPVGKSLKDLTYLTKIWKHQPLSTSVYFGHILSKYIY